MKSRLGDDRNSGDHIPLLDLVRPHREMEDELHEVLTKTVATASFVGGPMVEEFENAFAAYCDARYCVGVNSGTDAVRFALMAAGVKPGDAVITVPNTFIATAEAISQAGARPVFVDVDPQTYNMDCRKLQDMLENGCEKEEFTGTLLMKKNKHRVAAIVPVHLYGQPADMDPILQLAERYRLKVIEDACQAHGAKYLSRRENRWLTAGSIGCAAAFSFYPGKNLGACGEAGAVTTNDPELAAMIRMLRDHGQTQKYYHAIEGYNGRLDAIQAGFLSLKLQRLDEWNAMRRSAAQRYNEMFAAVDGRIVTPFEPSWSRPVYHLYVVQVDDRSGVRQELAAANIGTGIHYPVPLHLQKAYAALGYSRGDFPVTEKAAERILSLPMFPTLAEAEQRRVVDAVVQTNSGVVTDAAA
jgi:dTDP-4-amino-4,6-dideoxygalactose transaminase